MKYNILVTGGSGYLGSVMVGELLNAGYKVTVLDNFMFGQSSLLGYCHDENFNVVAGDARDESLLKELTKNIDIVIPLAALVGAPLCNINVIGAKTTNTGAIESLVKITSKDQKIIMPCTNSGYGIGQKGIHCTEETPLNPISFYGTTKVDAEKAILDRGNSVSLRLATVFGPSPRMRLDLLVNDFTYRAVNDRCLVVFEGHYKRNYIYIRDVARAFIHVIDNFDTMKDEPYNVGLSDANISKNELCEKLQQHLPKFVYLEAPIGEDPDKRNYIVSNDKIESTGYKPKYSLDDGIRQLIKCYTFVSNNKHGNV